MDIFQSWMVPAGAKHLPCFHCLCDSKRLLLLVKGIATVAKKLGIDFAESVTGFEFKHSRCIPVIEGIVVAEDKADVLFDVITSIIIMF